MAIPLGVTKRYEDVNGLHHGDNPPLKPPGIRIATKYLPGPTTREHRKLIRIKTMPLGTNYSFHGVLQVFQKIYYQSLDSKSFPRAVQGMTSDQCQNKFIKHTYSDISKAIPIDSDCCRLPTVQRSQQESGKKHTLIRFDQQAQSHLLPFQPRPVSPLQHFLQLAGADLIQDLFVLLIHQARGDRLLGQTHLTKKARAEGGRKKPSLQGLKQKRYSRELQLWLTAAD